MPDKLPPKADLLSLFRRSSKRSPLGFFISALAITYALVAAALWAPGLPAWLRAAVGIVAVALFVFLVLIVRELVIKHPHSLVLSDEAIVEAMRTYGDSDRGSVELPNRTPPEALPEGSDDEPDDGGTP